jgi:uncharacterized protein YndB with AHSA1/START domain
VTETADPRVIEIDQFYPHPPQRVWQALTTSELMARWLTAPSGFAPVVGTRFRFHGQPMPSVGFSGEIECEVIDVVDGKQLIISWADARSERPSAWVVSWTLRPEGPAPGSSCGTAVSTPRTPSSSVPGPSWATAGSASRPSSAMRWAVSGSSAPRLSGLVPRPHRCGAASRPGPSV